jgi:hypothetical protein
MQSGDPKPVAEAPVDMTNGLGVKPKSLPVKIVQALLPLLLVALAFVIKMYAEPSSKVA